MFSGSSPFAIRKKSSATIQPRASVNAIAVVAPTKLPIAVPAPGIAFKILVKIYRPACCVNATPTTDFAAA